MIGDRCRADEATRIARVIWPGAAVRICRTIHRPASSIHFVCRPGSAATDVLKVYEQQSAGHPDEDPAVEVARLNLLSPRLRAAAFRVPTGWRERRGVRMRAVNPTGATVADALAVASSETSQQAGPALARRAARCLRAIHQLRPAPPDDAERHRAAHLWFALHGPDRLGRLLGEEAVLRAAGLPGRAQQWRAELRQRLLAQQPQSWRSCVHGDFHPGNLLAAGTAMVAIDPAPLEFGNAGDDLAAFVSYVVYLGLRAGNEAARRRILGYAPHFMASYFGSAPQEGEFGPVRPFLAMRLLAKCDPLYYPTLTAAHHRVLSELMRMTLAGVSIADIMTAAQG